MLRLHLPPNLAAAAPRNAIALRVELDPAAPPPPELLPALALLQRWCGPQPPAFLQLTRAQLRELARAAGSQPVFVENGRAVAWAHDALLAEPAPPPQIENPKSKIENKSAATPLTIDGSEHYLALTLPSREHSGYAAALDLVKSHGFVLEPSNRKWWLRDRHKTLNFLAAHGERLRHEWHAGFTPNFEKNTARLRAAEVLCETVETSGGFDVTLGLRAGTAAPEMLRAAVASNRGYLETDGAIYLLDAAKMQALAAAQSALAGDPNAGLSTRRTHRVSLARAAEAQEILETLSPGFQPPATWRARSEALRHLAALTPAPVPAALDAQLRPYQRVGAAWLWHLHRHELGGILADEMGLGKTLQALALLCAVSNPPGPNLVVCPASLLENWRREAARFAPHLRVFIHHGESRLAATPAFATFDLVITSYGTLARDWELFSPVYFACVIADEAQHIKNRRSQNAAALRSLRARSRFLLTGTPLENSLDDLRSLFEFLLPGYLDRLPAGLRAEERAWFDERLRARVAPYILRRTKQAVAPELPAKLEQTIWCELSPAQAELYRATHQRTERELTDLAAGGANEGRLRLALLTQLLRLRQICCDPRLLEVGRVIPNAPQDVSEDPERRGKDNPPYPDSAKLEAFRELLAEAVDDGHRVLVFSQFTSLLALLRTELDAQQLAHCYLDGSMTTRARQAEVDRFQSSPNVAVFLISLKAGGTGLNLTGADTVVHFDPWWNPAVEAQATDRAHRIGQTRVVTSYKLIASGTVEEKVLALQEEKRALLAGVFEASDAAAAKLSLADLKDLLA
jgi:superfamily II DNA or RNA helicase